MSSNMVELLKTAHALDKTKMDSAEIELNGETITVYWKPDNYKTRTKYWNDAIVNKNILGYLKCVYLRALDENGKRIFKTQDHFELLKESTTHYVELQALAVRMMNLVDDDIEEREDDEKTAAKN